MIADCTSCRQQDWSLFFRWTLWHFLMVDVPSTVRSDVEIGLDSVFVFFFVWFHVDNHVKENAS